MELGSYRGKVVVARSTDLISGRRTVDAGLRALTMSLSPRSVRVFGPTNRCFELLMLTRRMGRRKFRASS